MHHTQTIPPIILLVILSALSCAQELQTTPAKTTTHAATPAPLSFTVTDSNGRSITFDEPPNRIVSFDSAMVEILFAIGEGKRIVGTHDFVSYPPESTNIPRLGDAFHINLEATVALEPDLVFVFTDKFITDLEKAGLRVLYKKSLDEDFRKVAGNIRMWGHITGNLNSSETLASQFENRVEKISTAMASRKNGPSIFQDEGDLWSAGPNTLIGEVFSLLKLQNIVHNISGYSQISPEVIIEKDPEIIIASYGNTISAKPAFRNLRAIKNDRIFVPKSDALSIAGPRYIDGIEELAIWIYPDLFD